ncbi:FAD-linked oxidoreductase [Knoellia sinensis KCTC 19936]|uniref:FAD-linked oxidoreductase n=1 Tax=Knoellia sinensis KCTC 19936 TaxID=1385520 RepID=A0A0A0J8U2_9MICO|nr:D-arabinono-1,4-lactone oxidase [Knoellia sinensis]KGN33860.1 FAD-linked oxidoreductase [Knoellia sinensis KCTC 19936]
MTTTTGRERTPTWTNWAGTASASPARVVEPRCSDEVADVVVSAAARGEKVRVVGSGHSFTPLCATDGTHVRLTHLSGILDVDRALGRVRVAGGTPLHVLNPILEGLGLALPNLGDIDRQTIAGAIATGTHGTGVRHQGIASAVVGLTLVLADGSVVSVDDAHDVELFEAARVGLGAFGVVTEVELQCVPAFRLRALETQARLSDVLANYEQMVAEHDHVDVLWFKHSDRVLLKRNSRVDSSDAGESQPRWQAWLDDELLGNRTLEAVNRLAAAAPRLAPVINEISGRAIGNKDHTDVSWKVFCSSRKVRFKESEYAVPLASLPAVIGELRAWIDKHGTAYPFPAEIRSLGADDVWLSTAYERESAYVAVQQYHRMDDGGIFAAFESIVREHDGRPHWGKLHTLGAEDFARLYPRFGDVLRVRDRVDPDRRFANDHLTHVLGA